MADTYLDQLVEYPMHAIHLIGNDETVAKLLTDNPNLSMSSDEAADVFDKYLYSYGYVDETSSEAIAYICVETEINRIPTRTIKDCKLYVTVVCHRHFMDIDTEKFTGIIGNRRDNLVRYVDYVLNGSDVFGLGELTLESVHTVNAPAGFSARELTYNMPDFTNK